MNSCLFFLVFVFKFLNIFTPDGLLGFLGVIFSIIGVYWQVNKNISNQDKYRFIDLKRKEIREYQRYRPFIIYSTGGKIQFRSESENIWFKYCDIYYMNSIANIIDYNRSKCVTQKLVHKQIGTVFDPLIESNYISDKDFILKVKTIKNEDLFIFVTSGDPNLSCYREKKNDQNYNMLDSVMMEADGYQRIKNGKADINYLNFVSDKQRIKVTSMYELYFNGNYSEAL